MVTFELIVQIAVTPIENPRNGVVALESKLINLYERESFAPISQDAATLERNGWRFVGQAVKSELLVQSVPTERSEFPQTEYNRLQFKRDQYSRKENKKSLLKFLDVLPKLTLAQTAKLIKADSDWIFHILSFRTKLCQAAILALESGRMPLLNAYYLTKLPLEEQYPHCYAASTEGHSIFKQLMLRRAAELRAIKRGG